MGSAKKVKSAGAALAAGLREARRERSTQEPASLAKAQRMLGGLVAKDPLDDLDSDEETDQLCAACLQGRAAAVRKALAAPGVEVNAVGSGGMTPLYIASQDGKSEIVGLLLAAKADVGLACFGGATPLYAACSKNHADTAKALVKAGAPVDAIANGYFTPLLACVSHGCEDAARTLLLAGADVHLTSPKWGTYLHAAAKSGKSDMCKLLLSYDLDVDAEHGGLTPRQLAERRQHAETAAVLQRAATRRARLRASASPSPQTRALSDAVAAEAAADFAAAVEELEAAARPRAQPVVEVSPEEAEAAEAAAEKKRLKRQRQKANKAAAAAAAEAAEEEGQAAVAAPNVASGAAGAAAVDADGAPGSLPPGAPPPPGTGAPPSTGASPSLMERRADMLLAERALAELCMEAGKKDRFLAAVEGAAAAKEKVAAKEAVRDTLHHLSMEAAKKGRFTAAVEEAAAERSKMEAKEEVAGKLRALVQAKVKAVVAAGTTDGQQDDARSSGALSPA